MRLVLRRAKLRSTGFRSWVSARFTLRGAGAVRLRTAGRREI